MVDQQMVPTHQKSVPESRNALFGIPPADHAVQVGLECGWPLHEIDVVRGPDSRLEGRFSGPRPRLRSPNCQEERRIRRYGGRSRRIWTPQIRPHPLRWASSMPPGIPARSSVALSGRSIRNRECFGVQDRLGTQRPLEAATSCGFLGRDSLRSPRVCIPSSPGSLARSRSIRRNR